MMEDGTQIGGLGFVTGDSEEGVFIYLQFQVECGDTIAVVFRRRDGLELVTGLLEDGGY